jgi:Predicted signal transduction protein with a C-terminal ATPase domain
MAINYYFSSQKMIEKKSKDFLIEISRQSNNRIEEFFKDIEKISLLAGYSTITDYETGVQEFLLNDNQQNEKRAYEVLSNAILYKERTYSIYLYNLNKGKNLFVNLSGKSLNYDYSPLKEEWFNKILDSKDAITIIDTHKDLQCKGSDNWVISVGRKVFAMDDGRILGVMVFNIDLNFVDKVCGKILNDKKADVNIINEDNIIIYNKDINNIGKKLSELLPGVNGKIKEREGGFIQNENGFKYIITYSSFSRANWKTVLSISSESISLESIVIKRNIVFIFILIIVFTFIISLAISSYISNPIKKLIKYIELIEKGDFGNQIELNSHDEIGLLADRFNTMSLELKKLVGTILNEQKLKTQAEINALQAQINPHFLYNTLNSLKWIATIQKSDKIVEMVEALIYMLRFTTSKIGDFVTIGEEIENVRNYIIIQNVRYYNKLEVDYDIDMELVKYRILKFTIQPIVENAIFHGLAGKEDGGRIKITMKKQEDDILITVEDDGIGMDNETLENLSNNISHKKDNFNSIGINNVNTRIKMHFGEKYGISFKSRLGFGTAVYVLIPALFDGGNND